MRTDGGNAVFATVVRYIAARMVEDEYGDRDDDLPAGLADVPATLEEIAAAFEQAGGFRFEADQTLVLSQLFVVLEAGMRTLADQAADQGQSVAAARIEWAADQARDMTAYLMEKHGSGDGGELILLGLDEDEYED